MPKEPKDMPQTVKRFCNLLWASFPGFYTVKFLFQRKTLFVSIALKFENHRKQIRRQYTQKTIDSHKDLWIMVQKCITEIKRSMNKLDE